MTFEVPTVDYIVVNGVREPSGSPDGDPSSSIEKRVGIVR
jgi:hypothetical protein